MGEQVQKKGSNTLLSRIAGIASTIIVIVVVALAAALVGVRLLGYTPFAVVSGSMEPAISVGDLVYVQEVDPEDIEEGDIITFVAGPSLTVVTHRVEEVDRVNEQFITKGDANNIADTNPVIYGNVLGTVAFQIPYIGYLASFLSEPGGLYVGIAVLLALIVFFIIIPLILREPKEETGVEAIPRGEPGQGPVYVDAPVLDEPFDNPVRPGFGKRPALSAEQLPSPAAVSAEEEAERQAAEEVARRAAEEAARQQAAAQEAARQAAAEQRAAEEAARIQAAEIASQRAAQEAARQKQAAEEAARRAAAEEERRRAEQAAQAASAPAPVRRPSQPPQATGQIPPVAAAWQRPAVLSAAQQSAAQQPDESYRMAEAALRSSMAQAEMLDRMARTIEGLSARIDVATRYAPTEEERRFAYEQAEVELQRTEDELRATEAELRKTEAEIQRAEADLWRAKAEFRQAEADLLRAKADLSAKRSDPWQ